MTWVVVGLGNPGDRYAATRHNIGAMVVDLLADQQRERFKKSRFQPVDIAEANLDGTRVLLAKSLSYMNESGPSYASVVIKAKAEAAQVIAVHDEIDLPFGALRVKLGGGTAGHNGLRSLQASLHTREFLRVRLGVGRPPGRQEVADFVLEPFAKTERDEVDVLVAEGAEAVRMLIADGLVVTQDRCNRSGAPTDAAGA